MSNSHALTPEDVLSFKNVDDAQIAPDGTCVAFVVGDSFKTDGKWARSSIWVVETTGGGRVSGKSTCFPQAGRSHSADPNRRRERMQGHIRQLVIHSIRENVFHAYLLIETREKPLLQDCRPSDGLVMATRLGAPIYLTPEVIEQAGGELEGA